ncbi:MAG: hypothetical protein JXR12_15370 [Neptunomonas phycophila]|uniref:hypothetical protein n=1 Tax=Neptunomonas phycophila TaxID=1572645 RepID=UPI003B8D3E72
MKNFFAAVGFFSMVFAMFFLALSDDNPTTVRSAEDVARAEYAKKYEDDIEKFKYAQRRLPADATDVKYLGNRWTVFRLYGQCFITQSNHKGNYSYLGLSDVDDAFCDSAPHIIPEFEFRTDSVGVQY